MKRSLNWIEAARTSGMALVVLAHINDTSYFSLGSKEWWSIGISVLVCCAVPMFFMVSGYLLGRKETPTINPPSKSIFFKRKFETIIIPFFAWNIIYMFLFKAIFNWPILSGKTIWFLTTGYMHLYFVFVLIQFYFIYYLIKPYLNERGLNVTLTGAILLTLLFYITSELLLWIQGPDHHFFEWHYGKVFIHWGIFYFWGAWIRRFTQVIVAFSRHLLLLGLGTIVAFTAFYWETHLEVTLWGYNVRQYFLITGILYQFISANFILALFYRLDQLYKKSFLLNFLSRSGIDTFGIYLSHLAIIYVLLTYWNVLNFSPMPLIKIPCLFAMTWFFSQMLVKLLRLKDFIHINKILFGGR